MTFYKPNQKYNTTLSADYTIGDTVLGVTLAPSETPTILTVARGTDKETRFTVTGSGIGQATGVARLDGANTNIPAGSSVECMNDREFVDQVASAVYDQSGLKGLVYAADGGSTDAYAITLPVAPTAYSDLTGIPLAFKANTVNTGAATLAVNAMSGGPKNIKKFGSSGIQDLTDSDIQAGQVVIVVYDGTQFILIGTTVIPAGASIISPIITGTGTATLLSAIISKISGPITTDADGATITFDCAVSRHQVVLGGNRTLALSNLSNGQITAIELIQDGTGSRTVTWPSFGAVATMTIATPGVVTAGKDIPTGTPVIFTTTGALPTGVTAGTVYWWTRIDATTGKLSTSLANCQAGTYIATSGSQSGVHTMAVQIRWPSQTAPTLTTGKYLGDIINFYVKDAINTIVEGIVATNGI